jgi:hypothetical protein
VSRLERINQFLRRLDELTTAIVRVGYFVDDAHAYAITYGSSGCLATERKKVEGIPDALGDLVQVITAD